MVVELLLHESFVPTRELFLLSGVKDGVLGSEIYLYLM